MYYSDFYIQPYCYYYAQFKIGSIFSGNHNMTLKLYFRDEIIEYRKPPQEKSMACVRTRIRIISNCRWITTIRCAICNIT